MSHLGMNISGALASELTFERLRLSMPYQDRWRDFDSMKSHGLCFEIDLGTVLSFSDASQEQLADRCRAYLEEIFRMVNAEWTWNTNDRTIFDLKPLWQVVGDGTYDVSKADLVEVPADIRRILTLNFDSKNDAMLVRMTILDMVVARDDYGRGTA